MLATEPTLSVTVVMAASIDGKIGPVSRSAMRFGEADLARLERHCAEADVLLMGAGALRAHGTTVRLRTPDLLDSRRQAGLPEQPLTCIVSASGRLDSALPFFTRQAVPRLIATTTAGGEALPTEVRQHAEVWCSPGSGVDFAALRRDLAARGLTRLVLLGGGGLLAAWLTSETIDRLELTVAPLLLGGAAAPTLLDGAGLPRPLDLRLDHVERDADLLFLSYCTVYPAATHPQALP